MILVLSFFIFIIVFFVFGLIFSKIKIKVKKINFEMFRSKLFKNDYCINAGIYLYGKIKFLSVNFENNYIKMFGRKINVRNIKMNKFYKNIMKTDMREIDKKEIINNFKNLNVKFEKFNLNLDLGTDSTLVTSFLIFVVSTIVSIIVKKGVTRYNPKKHSFIITPRYENYNLIKIDLNCILSFKTLNVLKMIWKINKIAKNKQKTIESRLINKNKQYPGYV